MFSKTNPGVYATDFSKEALEIAKINVERLRLNDTVSLLHGSWFDALREHNGIKFAGIVSNPPYIPTNDIKKLQKEVKEYDPFIALNGGKDGLDAYKLIMPKLRNIIKKNGKIFFEIGKGQENFVSSKAMKHGLSTVEYKKDLSGVNRIVVFIIK